MADVDLTPTAEMARNAARGLELRREHGRGGTEVGVARARDISNGKGLSPETVRRMHAFFSRHAKNKAGGEDDAGYIAWMLWGGDEGRDWASRKVDALDRKERNAMSETRKAIMERLGFASKSRFDDDCGTGAGGFKPGNKCGAEDGKGGGGAAPEAKKRKRKPKRTPLAGPKVEKPAKILSRDALGDMASDAPEYREDWQAAEEALSGRTDPQGKTLRGEMSSLVKRWAELDAAIDGLDEYPSKKNREAQAKQRKALGDELNRLQQRSKRIIRDAKKTERTAKRSPVEQAGSLLDRAMKQHEQMTYDIGIGEIESAVRRLGKKGGKGSKKVRGNLMQLQSQLQQIGRQSEALNEEFIDARKSKSLTDEQATDLKNRAGQLLQRMGQWRTSASSLLKTAKTMASRLGDKRLFALVVRAQKILARRPGRPARFGFLSRIGRAATALTARPADTTAPDYASQVEEAKKAAISEVNGYRFLRDKVVARQQAMDAYVKQAAAAIAKSRVAPDIRHFTDQIRTAVKAQQMMLFAVKTPFSRKGARMLAALADACWEGYESVGMKEQDGKTVPNCVPKARAAKPERKAKNCNVDAKPLAYGKGEGALEREDVKAGLKLMSASDPAVSDKIRKLIKEGKPQEQAVAIALDMKRRGEL